MRCARLVWLGTVDRRLKGAAKVKKWMWTNFCILFRTLSVSLSLPLSDSSLSVYLSAAHYILMIHLPTLSHSEKVYVFMGLSASLTPYLPSAPPPLSVGPILSSFACHIWCPFCFGFCLLRLGCSATFYNPQWLIYALATKNSTRGDATHVHSLECGTERGVETRKSVEGRDWQRQRLKVCNAKYRHS